MSNFNEENQDEEDIEETFPISSQDALLAIEKSKLVCLNTSLRNLQMRN